MTENETLECADCGAILENNGEQHENDDGESVCEVCRESYVTCGDCGEIVPRDSEHRNADGEAICESCGEHYSACGDCGAILHEDNGTWITDAEILVCGSCLEDRYYRCEDCGRYVSEDGSHGLGSGGRICQTCYERNDYGRCSDCGDLYHTSDLNYDEDEDYCDECFRVRQSDSDIAIHQYAYKPP